MNTHNIGLAHFILVVNCEYFEDIAVNVINYRVIQ